MKGVLKANEQPISGFYCRQMVVNFGDGTVAEWSKVAVERETKQKTRDHRHGQS